MTLEPGLAAALAIHSRKGAYAVLLGSGASRSAGIPTGWDVMRDLARRAATLTDPNFEGDPIEWIQKQPDLSENYSTLLEALAPRPADRSGILRQYFEPSGIEAEQGLKSPTELHRSLAKLVKSGFIRVILTTNFDRLVETALAAEGIAPVVVKSESTAEGMPPLQHSACTLIKLNGDYQDLATRNTEVELKSYPRAVNDLLSRAFTEYGTIICGWSGDWDHALCETLIRTARCPFSTFWMKHGVLGERAKEIISMRNATVIEVESGDVAFGKLSRQIEALDSATLTDPRSSQGVLTTAKRLVARSEDRVRLHELVRETCTEAQRATRRIKQECTARPMDASMIGTALQQARAATQSSACAFFVCGRWGNADHSTCWKPEIRRVATVPHESGVINNFTWGLQYLPASVGFYAIGLGMLCSEKWPDLRALFETATNEVNRGTRTHFADILSAPRVLPVDPLNAVNRLEGIQPKKLPASDWMAETLGAVLACEFGDQAAFDAAFDRFEVLLALACLDISGSGSSSNGPGAPWFPPGRFAWKLDTIESPLGRIQEELEVEGASWPPLASVTKSMRVEDTRSAIQHVRQVSSRLAWS